jgi:hypothetical protein
MPRFLHATCQGMQIYLAVHHAFLNTCAFMLLPHFHCSVASKPHYLLSFMLA